MFNSRHLVVALALVASAACSSSVDLTDPNVIAGELRGTWSRTFDAPGNSTVLQLSVHDSTITGTGAFAGEAGPSGTLIVTGKIVMGQSGPSVNIDFVQSNGPVGHFTGTLRAADMLDGSVWYSPATGLGVGDPIVATFRRTSR